MSHSEDGDLLDFGFPTAGPTFVRTDATDFAVDSEMRVAFSPGPAAAAEVPSPCPSAGFVVAARAVPQLRPARGRVRASPRATSQGGFFA